MIKKYLFLLFTMLIVTSLYAKEKEIEIRMGDYSKASDGRIITYKITASNDGIIKDIVVSNSNYNTPRITREGNRIIIPDGVVDDIRS